MTNPQPYKRYRSIVYENHFTAEKTDWLKNNCANNCDRKSALLLNIPKEIVTAYRADVLRISKRRTEKPIDMNFRNCKVAASLELKALKEYNYSGIMQDSVNDRIEFLTKMVNS